MFTVLKIAPTLLLIFIQSQISHHVDRCVRKCYILRTTDRLGDINQAIQITSLIA